MTFISIAFIAFFIVVSAAYYVLPSRFRWILLLVASCYFYMAFVPKYIFILFALILIDYFMARLIERNQGRSRKIFFLISIFANIGILFVFKYFNFFSENLGLLAHVLHWNYSISTLRLILPLGLSFHTFQSLSYVIEVYRGKYKAERHLGIYALYVMFFPQLVAGPIERPYHLLPQLKKKVTFDWQNVFSGLRLMCWGFFKKVVIADRLAMSVNYVFGNIPHVPGLSILLATIFFAFQLYTDFSGYSDIARGSARVLGIDIVRNFEQPYFSVSIAEFWRRWHISLSSWFRDYMYFPLAYSAKKASRLWLYFCVIATFLVTGLWHGANWTFVAMGGLYGMYIVCGLLSRKMRGSFVSATRLAEWPKTHKFLQQIFVFILASFAWIFFRAPDLHTATIFIGRAFSGWDNSLGSLFQAIHSQPFQTLGFSFSDLLLSIAGIIVLLYIEHFEYRGPLGVRFAKQSIIIKSFVYTGLALSLLIFGVYSAQQFIYFQF